MRIIDMHAHAFPDALAARAVPALEREGNIRAFLDGTVRSLVTSMDRAGIETSVICSIATKPSQFEPILAWSRAVASPRLVPFPSIHPADPLAAERVRKIHETGLRGIKLHPYYQDFHLDEDRVLPIYEEAQRLGLIVVAHNGFDIAFPRIRRADAERVLRVAKMFPRLKIVATHLGGWEDWGEAERVIIGKPIWVETSMSISGLGREAARRFLVSHPEDRILFGTDSPWEDQAEAVAAVRSLELGEGLERRILGENAASLLGV